MIPIIIDTQDLSAEFSLDREAVDSLLEYTVKEITAQYAQIWASEAKNSLNSAKRDYLNSIRIDTRGRFTGIAYLDPITWLANAVEVGAPEFDMKPGFMGSPKAKNGKRGRYMTIPFRFATPGSVGESSAFAGVMPAVVQKAVKAAEREGSKSGASLGDIPRQYQMPKSHSLRREMRATGFETVKKGTEMTSKYEGLQRNAVGSGYVTFRRVSEFSDPDAFIHPGIKAMNLADKALSRFEGMIPQIVDVSVDNFLVSLGF